MVYDCGSLFREDEEHKSNIFIFCIQIGLQEWEIIWKCKGLRKGKIRYIAKYRELFKK